MPNEDEVRVKYFEHFERAGTPHRNRAFEYEKLAIDYTTSTFRTLTYLYGGALVALPAAVALFHVDATTKKILLVQSAGWFVGAVLLICLAQSFAFFTMARRSESAAYFAAEANLLVGLTHYPESYDSTKARAEAQTHRDAAIKKAKRSDIYRGLGITCLWFSMFAFLMGCYLGACAVLDG